MKYGNFLVVLLFISYSLFAQKEVPKKAKKWVQEARQLIKVGQSEQAIPLLQKAIKKYEAYENAYVFLADAFEKTGQLKQSIETYDKLMQLKPNLTSKTIFTKANLYKKYGQYELAIDAFNQYLNLPDLKTSSITKAKDLLSKSNQLLELKNNPVPFNPISLGAIINSSDLEYLPSLTADEQTLVFTKKMYEANIHEDFYMSKKIKGEWTEPKRLKVINTPGDEGAQSISADGKTIYFAASDRMGGYGNFDIWVAKKKGDYWDEVQNLGPNINTSKYESQPSISTDGKTLFFCSKGRSEAIGGYDIYKSELINGTWGKAELLDTTINTNQNEVCPFIHHDGQTLYFGSDGHLSFGDEDLFKSEWINGQWTKAENLGYPINTHNNESSLVIGATGKKAYFSSDRENGEGGLDLYSFNLPKKIKPKPVTYFKGVVKNAETLQPIVAEIQLVQLNDNQVFFSTLSDEVNGAFLTTLHADIEYACNVSATGYLFHSEHFTFKTNPNGEPYILEIFLQPVPVITKQEATKTVKSIGSKVILNNIFFDSGKAALLPASTLELNRLTDLLNEHPNLNIQVNGHTDNVGSDVENMTLSENRAKAVVVYLESKGIASIRLRYKGFGETQPLNQDDTDAARAQNRRTEFEIVP